MLLLPAEGVDRVRVELEVGGVGAPEQNAPRALIGAFLGGRANV